MTEIHRVELKEEVLHDWLVSEIMPGRDLPKVLALAPGRFHLQSDLYRYPFVSPEQALVSLAKVNFKRLLLAIKRQWRVRGVAVDLALSLNPPLGRRRCMLSSAPGWQAKRLTRLAFLCINRGWQPAAYDLCSEEFDPWVVVGREGWLFDPEPEEAKPRRMKDLAIEQMNHEREAAEYQQFSLPWPRRY